MNGADQARAIELTAAALEKLKAEQRCTREDIAGMKREIVGMLAHLSKTVSGLSAMVKSKDEEFEAWREKTDARIRVLQQGSPAE